jgi:hypothetical protein
MDSAPRGFASGFFTNHFPPGPSLQNKSHFKFLLRTHENIRSSRCTTCYNDTSGKWNKSSIRKVLTILSSLRESKCVVDTGRIFATGGNDTDGNCNSREICDHCVSDTTCKFAVSVNSDGGPVTLTPVVHLDLRISPRICEKNWNGAIGIIRDLGEDGSWKNLVALSL